MEYQPEVSENTGRDKIRANGSYNSHNVLPMRGDKMRLKPAKAKALIAYIKGEIPRCSRQKLNLALFYSDMKSYLNTGKSLTGFTYIAERSGPAPHPMQWARVTAK